MRSLLFVPGDSDRKLQKSLQSGADALIVDLEDSVVPSGKPAARKMTAAFFAGLGDRNALPPLFIRINDLTSGFTEADLDAVVPLAPTGLVLPKVRGGADVRSVAELVEAREQAAGLAPGSISFLAIATETPQAVLAMGSFEGASPRLKGLAWGGEDLATAVGASTNRDAAGAYTGAMQLARNLCLLAAAAADVQAIDTVFTDFRDPVGLEQEARDAARDGFTGKMAIHPNQVATINAVFTPNEADVAHAEAVIAAFEAEPEAGVVSVDGRMLDRPHLAMAERTLARARMAGLSPASR